MTSATRERARATTVAWVFFWLAALVFLAQCASLVSRGTRGESDIGVFVRTARAIDRGAGEELYERRDPVTGWPIAIPPAGTVFFQPLLRIGETAAVAGWAVFNLALAWVALLGLRVVLDGAWRALFPWLGAVFLFLGGGSVQVGQFSLMFAAMWVLALWCGARGCDWGAALFWAWPAAIKAYPAVLFAAPAFAGKDLKAALWRLLRAALALVVVFVVLPWVFYGGRAWELEVSFVRNVLLDPSGRVKWMQALGTTANQGLDSVLIRYLSYYPKFHDAHPWVPTPRWDLDFVRSLGHVVRLALLAVTAVFAWRGRRAEEPYLERLVWQASLWSSALYVCLPETRARYAVYAFLAFLPILVTANKRVEWYGVGLVCLLFLLGALPAPLDVLGVGFLASVALWAVNLWWQTARRAGA